MPESPDVNALKGVNLHDLLQGIQRKGTRLPEDLDPFLQSAAPAPEARRQHRRLESLRREAEEQARERRLAALFSGDAAADPSAEAAYHNDARLQALLLELGLLEEFPPASPAEAAREMRGQARRLLETLSVPAPVSRHMAAERRAAEEGDKALARGETQEAIKAKRRQILNHALVLEALEVAGATRNEPASRDKDKEDGGGAADSISRIPGCQHAHGVTLYGVPHGGTGRGSRSALFFQTLSIPSPDALLMPS